MRRISPTKQWPSTPTPLPRISPQHKPNSCGCGMRENAAYLALARRDDPNRPTYRTDAAPSPDRWPLCKNRAQLSKSMACASPWWSICDEQEQERARDLVTRHPAQERRAIPPPTVRPNLINQQAEGLIGTASLLLGRGCDDQFPNWSCFGPRSPHGDDGRERQGYRGEADLRETIRALQSEAERPVCHRMTC